MIEEFCPRLADYVVLVGSHSTNRTTTTVQTPTILNRFPPLDHKDFILPPDVALFCQPEGCFNTSGSHCYKTDIRPSTSGNVSSSFIFTLTDKESSKVRYGICLNFFRPIHRRPGSRKHSSGDKTVEANKWLSDVDTTQVVSPKLQNYQLNDADSFESGSKLPSQPSARLYRRTLTSLCLITHHPFFTKFRALVEFLYTLIHKLHQRSRSKLPERETVWSVLTGATLSAHSPLVIRSVREIEKWILQLMSAPAPIPGKTCLHLFVQPKTLMKPLMFALPDKSRLPLIDFPLHLPIQLLGIARTLRILVCLLLEQKVVLQSSDYNKLSICVLAFTALLYPLQYMFPIIPLLPPCMPDAEQLLIAPTPYIIGVPTGFYSARKVFRIPKDVWLANLDTQELSYPEVMEEIPDLPEPECKDLVDQLEHALETLSSTKENDNVDSVLSEIVLANRRASSVKLMDYNPLTYISDEDSISVATRVSMIRFLQTPNILGGLSLHTRTLRLYPRPVVAFQFENFMKSRPRPCLFTSMLAKTQAVEYFAEVSLCAQNEAYQRIMAGEYGCESIGDKTSWFGSLLNPVTFDVWPASAEHVSARSSLSNEEFNGSPLLYAFVAARLQAASSSARSEKGLSESLFSTYPRGITSPDEASDYPTDESASDTETEHSTASVCSTLSDLTSDYFDSGIGESQNKAAQRMDLDSSKPRDLSDVASGCEDHSSRSTESVVVRSGEPIPSSLAIYFNPPEYPIYGPCGESPDECDKIVDDSQSEEAEDPVSPPGAPESTMSSNADSDKLTITSPPSSDGVTTDTVRTLTKLSVSMFSGNSSASSGDSEKFNQGVIANGRINWSSPFFSLIGELFNFNSPELNELVRLGQAEKEFKKRLEDERYLTAVAKDLNEGNIPGFFSRNRVISMLESENNRNLLLSRVNQCPLNLLKGDLNYQYVDDVAIQRWSQYKALVWILRHIVNGLEASIRSDIFIPTPTNARNQAYPQKSRSLAPADYSHLHGGGLASAFALLEVAHTHYYLLPKRQDRAPRPSNQMKSPLSPVSRKSTSSFSLDTTSDLPLAAPPTRSTNRSNSGLKSPSADSPKSTTFSDEAASEHENLAKLPPISPNSVKVTHSPKLVGSQDRIDSGSIGFDPNAHLTPTPSSTKLSVELRSPKNSYGNGSLPNSDMSLSPFIAPKSDHSRGYRYRSSRLVPSPLLSCPDLEAKRILSLVGYRHSVGDMNSLEKDQARQLKEQFVPTKSGRTYVFEDLIAGNGKRSKLWDDLQFWEDAFLDAVAQERDILGMDFRPFDLLTHYSTANPLKRKHCELEEDRLLAGLMHNLIAFMVVMNLDVTDIRRKIRRLLAKSHMGLHYSQEISNLLDVLEYLSGNDIDLKPVLSRSIPQRSYEVHQGTDSNGPLVFIEVCDDYLLLRNISGSILGRWWYNQLINIIYRNPILCISIRSNGQSSLNNFYTKKCQMLYNEIKQAMEQVSLKAHRGPLGGDLGGELNVVCLANNCPGTIKVCADGFALNVGSKKSFIAIPNVKRCSAPQYDLFVIEYFDSIEKHLRTEKFHTDVASDLLYHFHLMITSMLSSVNFDESATSPL